MMSVSWTTFLSKVGFDDGDIEGDKDGGLECVGLNEGCSEVAFDMGGEAVLLSWVCSVWAMTTTPSDVKKQKP